MAIVDQQAASAVRPFAVLCPKDALAELRCRLQAPRWQAIHVLRKAFGTL
ncbi:hypothetical protein SAMN05660209_01021 [Geodermatophilus africanus]|uniref:Uncharacterized protein n=1 Tax=Geodermatophilus africanus TaxID=1137993 RepID=A0A1H3DJT0_9ACTN|nr:hypothetical protein [Geodermatophilus africanus]SDX66686.1 hypothetical protein SAMN05660209_01021 [Geodermatophilus africanus]